MPTSPTALVYGEIPRDLAEVPPDAVQCSPRAPGAIQLDGIAPASCAKLVMHAPANAIERRHEMARALRVLKSDGVLTVLAHNTRGGNRIYDELTAFGCDATAGHKRHHRIVQTLRGTATLARDEAIAAGAPRLSPELDAWTQPGLFSWDHVDPGSRLLMQHLPALEGRGADLGCGIGLLARHARQLSPTIALTLIDIDRRAVDLAARNVAGDGIATLWADIRTPHAKLPTGLDFIITNPPFHDGGAEDKALGQAFIAAAARMLRPGGVLWLVANRHLPYEATLQPLFAPIDKIAEQEGYKVYRATKSAVAARERGPVRPKARR